MNKTLTLTAKIAIFLSLALIFAATMVALSIRTHPERFVDSGYSANEKRIDKTFPVQSGGRLVVDADEGSISVTGSDRQDVAVHIRARGSESRLAKLDISVDQSGNTVKAVSRYRHSFMNMFGGEDFDVEFVIEVPSHFNLDLSTAGGDMTVNAVNGTLEGETSGGDLDLSKLDGHIRMNTSGGTVTMRDIKGDCKVGTSGGNMTAESVVGSMDFETSGGNIEVRESDGKLHASTSGGDVRVTLRDNKGIDLETSGGNLIVKLPKTISGDISAETTGGDVSCDFQFMGKLQEGSLRGKINGGGNIIRLETSGGDIVISSIE